MIALIRNEVAKRQVDLNSSDWYPACNDSSAMRFSIFGMSKMVSL